MIKHKHAFITQKIDLIENRHEDMTGETENRNPPSSELVLIPYYSKDQSDRKRVQEHEQEHQDR